jgi:hypothetical protein
MEVQSLFAELAETPENTREQRNNTKIEDGVNLRCSCNIGLEGRLNVRGIRAHS